MVETLMTLEGKPLLDVPHPDGGSGVSMIALADGSIAVKVRASTIRVEVETGDAVFLIGPVGVANLRLALALLPPEVPPVSKEVTDE